MSRKAQGLSINTIIIATIAIVVLVVLVAIFSGRLGIFSQQVAEVGQDCKEFKATVGGSDYPAGWQQESCGEGYREVYTATDADEHPGEHCCIVTG